MATWNLSKTKQHLLFCNGSSCNRKGAEETTLAIRYELTEKGLDDYVHTTRTRCNGRCKDAPVVISYPDGTWFKEVTEDMASEFVEKFIQSNQLLEKNTSHVIENGTFKTFNDSVEIGMLKSEKK